MPILYDYLDYRQFLRAFYETRKQENTFYSYRYIARKTGLDAGYVVKIFQGKLHIPEKYLGAFCALCGLSPRDTEYFRTLVDFNKAKSESRIKHQFEKLLSFKIPGKQKLRESQYEYYHKWYYAAIRSLIGIIRFTGDCSELVPLLTPPVGLREVKKAVALLEQLGLIRKQEDGAYKLTDTFVTTGDSWRSLAVREYQRETMRLAMGSLDLHPKEERDISTVTVGINNTSLPELRELIREFRDSVLKLAAESGEPDGVYQLNVQLFPMAMARRS